MAKKIVYGTHAEEKFEILRRHGFIVTKRQVRETLRKPDKIDEGFRGRKVAQRRISETCSASYLCGRSEGDCCGDFLSGEKEPL